MTKKNTQNIKIINTFTNSDGTTAYVEFSKNGKTKILSREHFLFRYGNGNLNDFKRARSHEKSSDARLSVKDKKTQEVA